VKLLWHQLRTEQLVFWRSREAAFFIFIFPLLLFLLLGAVYHGRYQGVPIKWAVIAGLIAYGCANTAFAGLAIQLVIRREAGILKRMRSTPLPPHIYVAALLLSTLVVFALQTIALFLLGRALYGTPLPREFGSLAVSLVLGALVFAALGTATASVIRSAEGSSAVVNFILLPMAFLSGAFGPTTGYPAVLRAIGAVLPLTYLVKLVDAIYLHGQGFWTQPEAIAILAAWGVAGVVFTALKFQWEPRGR
jgi:ABC-2 type transport system permease protein